MKKIILMSMVLILNACGEDGILSKKSSDSEGYSCNQEAIIGTWDTNALGGQLRIYDNCTGARDGCNTQFDFKNLGDRVYEIQVTSSARPKPGEPGADGYPANHYCPGWEAFKCKINMAGTNSMSLDCGNGVLNFTRSQ